MQRLLNFDWAFVKEKLNAKHSEVFKVILEELTASKRTSLVPYHTFVFEQQKMVECCGGIELQSSGPAALGSNLGAEYSDKLFTDQDSLLIFRNTKLCQQVVRAN